MTFCFVVFFQPVFAMQRAICSKEASSGRCFGGCWYMKMSWGGNWVPRWSVELQEGWFSLDEQIATNTYLWQWWDNNPLHGHSVLHWHRCWFGMGSLPGIMTKEAVRPADHLTIDLLYRPISTEHWHICCEFCSLLQLGDVVLSHKILSRLSPRDIYMYISSSRRTTR